jgi:hypothetical protein
MFFKIRKILLARFVLALALLGGLLGTVPIQTVYAATLIVRNTNDSGSGSLPQAISDAISADDHPCVGFNHQQGFHD